MTKRAFIKTSLLAYGGLRYTATLDGVPGERERVFVENGDGEALLQCYSWLLGLGFRSRDIIDGDRDRLFPVPEGIDPDILSTPPCKTEHVPAHAITIFMAGDLSIAEDVCRRFCDEHGECVTVEPTTYVYTGGQEVGVRVGFINYARFPRLPPEIYRRAGELALRLRVALRQDSFTLQTPTESVFYSWRKSDL